MILVELDQKEDTHLCIRGHAENNDIVCAAVSGLFYALLGYLKEAGCGFEKFSVKPGYAELKFKEKKKEAVRMFEIGIREIEKAHSENLKLVKHI